jgi:hypothetical protein
MMIYLDDYTLADEVPAADAVEQQQPVDVSVEDAGLDPGYVTNLLQRDANPSDVIDQAIIVPMTTATSTPPGSKRREQRRLRRHFARRGPTGSGRQGAPTQRGRPRTRRRRRPGMSGFGLGPPVRQPDSGCSRYAFSQSAQDDFFGVGRTVSIRSLSVAGASLA